MCFRFGSCFGTGSGQDYGRSTPKTTQRGGRSNWGSLADHGYYSGADYKAPPAYQQQRAAVDKPEHNAHNDGGVQKDHAYDSGHGYGPSAGGYGGYTPSVEGKANNEALKHPAAWHNKVAEDASQAAQAYTAPVNDTAAGNRREHAIRDHHRYPTITTNTATLAR